MKATFVTACGARQWLEIPELSPTYYLLLRQRPQANWWAHVDEPPPPQYKRLERRFRLASVHRSGPPDYALTGIYEEEL